MTENEEREDPENANSANAEGSKNAEDRVRLVRLHYTAERYNAMKAAPKVDSPGGKEAKKTIVLWHRGSNDRLNVRSVHKNCS